MRVYLAGPMRGYANFNFPAFDFAAAKLRAQGFDVFSPAERDREREGDDFAARNTEGDIKKATAQGFSLRAALGDDTAWISANADAVALLPGWEASPGANAEKALAVALGLTQIFLGREYVQ